MKYLVCNLKANKLKDDIALYEENISNIVDDLNIEFIICPPTPFLYLFQNDNYKLGSQDVSQFGIGSYTGENTAEQLSSLNVKYTLVGHSERRNLLNEDEATIISKIKKAYHSHIQPIYFIGEQNASKEESEANKILERQISHIINEVPDYKREKLIIVYEPVWAIGTGLTPTLSEITARINFIKKIIKEYYDLSLPVLYGGSVNENNIDELITVGVLDGFVVGESSLETENLKKIYEKIQKKI